MPAALQRFLRENRNLLLFLCLMAVFRSSFADWNDVPTTSMDPSIHAGDRIVVDKLAYDLRLPLLGTTVWRLGEPERGDIVVFDSAAAGLRLVKRVIGLLGDTVVLRDNRLYINGEAVAYDPVSGDVQLAIEALGGRRHYVRSKGQAHRLDSFGPVTVPPDHYLVLGDNRDDSADSRVYGLVPRRELVGRATRVVFSLDRQAGWRPRGDRFFHRLDTLPDDA